jgi:parallel beta-helix repeat protein
MDRSGFSLIILFFLALSLFVSVFTSSMRLVKASDTIYINADGTINPSTAPILRSGDLYNLTGDITGSVNAIRILRSNMTFDGQGYTVQGQGSSGGTGLFLNGTNNVLVKNVNIVSFYVGIRLSEFSNNNTITKCSISGNTDGIQVIESSGNTTISWNTLIDNSNSGVWIEGSSSNTVSSNSLTDNGYGVMLKQSNYNVVLKNSVRGGYGVAVEQCSFNSVSENNVLGSPYGIMVVNYASYNTVTQNSINGSIWVGLRLYEHAVSNNVTDNNVTNIEVGVDLNRQCTSNNIIANDIAFNSIGISIDDSSNNQIYHNRIRNNTEQVDTDGTVNIWDNGYPSGGNFWSDYEDVYPNATEIDASNLWNIPYDVDSHNQDNYPIIPEFSILTVAPILAGVTLLAATIFRRRKLSE